MAFGTIESRFKWVFGAADPSSLGGPGQAANVLGSTGAGVAFNTGRMGERFTFYVECDGGNTCAYQLRSARTSSGPWNIISSGTVSTGAVDVITTPGPLAWLSPRLKTIKSTSFQVTIDMVAN